MERAYTLLRDVALDRLARDPLYSIGGDRESTFSAEGVQCLSCNGHQLGLGKWHEGEHRRDA